MMRWKSARPWAAVALGLLLSPAARGQVPPAPNPPATTVEERLRRLEEANERLRSENGQLRDQVRDLSEKYDGLARPVQAGASDLARDPARDPVGDDPLGRPAGSASEPGDTLRSETGRGPVEAPTPVRPGEVTLGTGAASVQRKVSSKLPVKVNFGPGFELMTEDEEFQLQIHNMTALEYRGYDPAGPPPTTGGFFLARERWYFTGRVTKGIEYYTSTNRSYGNFDLLDAYLNFHYDPRLQVRVGRYRVPYSYEWWAFPIQTQIQPERSVFAVNYGLARMLGAMGWGQLLDKRVDYAVGVFNGSRNSFEDTNTSKDVITFMNVRPFDNGDESSWPALRFLNLGGSTDFGSQDNPVVPQALRTSVNASNTPSVGAVAPAFLTFNRNVRESGERALWSMHAAYYYKQLSLIGEWESGFVHYGRTDAATRTRVPLSGYYVQGAYMLTGETGEGRTMIKPKRPFSLAPGRRGPGAIELAARWASLSIGDEVFTRGLADPNSWTNRVGILDLGWNWYWNEYLKFYFVWEHSEFASSISAGPDGERQKTNNLFWIRALLYY